MECESCNMQLSSKMRGALANNACPFCSQSIMATEKATQYYNLLEMLDQTTFTNRLDVDGQIKEKVASLMITNFIFMKLERPDVADDIIVVNDEPSHQSRPQPQLPITQKLKEKKKKAVVVPKPAKSVQLQQESSSGRRLNAVTEDSIDDSMASRVPTPRPKQRLASSAPVGKTGLTLSDFQSAQDDSYTDRSSMMSDSNNSLSADEIMQAFPGMTPDQAIQALQREADLVQNSSVQRGLTGKGIKRLNG